MRKTQKAGFTLMEISIVIVIIGLIIGAIFSAQELIRASKRQKIMKDITEMQVQANTFRLKYNCIPGDCDTVMDYFGSGIYLKGDGNGVVSQIAAGYVDANTHSEELMAYLHITAAGLAKYTAASTSTAADPCYRNDSLTGVQWEQTCKFPLSQLGAHIKFSSPSVNGFGMKEVLGACINANLGCVSELGTFYGSALNPEDIRILDVKMDDGLPLSGDFVSACVAGVTYHGAESFNNFTQTTYNVTTQQYDTKNYKQCHGFKKF